MLAFVPLAIMSFVAGSVTSFGNWLAVLRALRQGRTVLTFGERLVASVSGALVYFVLAIVFGSPFSQLVGIEYLFGFLAMFIFYTIGHRLMFLVVGK